MSFLVKTFPWLFEEVADAPVAVWRERLAQASPEEKRGLVRHKATPAKALTMMARDPDTDIRTVLTKRLATILPALSPTEQIELYDLTVEALRALAEDQVTTVRIALASALKDVAKAPHDVARKLADDAERAVAEPILRYSLSLSDQDLLELIARHPQDWHPVAIAQRQRLTAQVGEAIAKTENIDAGRALLRNDGAIVTTEARKHFGRNQVFAADLHSRDGFLRKIKRDWYKVTDPVLYKFLREDVALDQVMTMDVMTKVHQHMTSQDNLKEKPAQDLSIEEIRDALKLGETQLVIDALSHRSRIPAPKIRRMLDADSGRAVIALCVKAAMPMSFATLAQSKLARLAPNKMVYPKNGEECPLSTEELEWQWDFFGV
jgi:hypothetical protein